MTAALLKWTGHPLADVGVATLCAMVEKTDPGELTLDDLDACGKEIKAAYTDKLFDPYLACVYTFNGPFTNPTMKPEKRELKKQRVLFPHRGSPDPGTAGVKCVFSGEPATHLLDREQMPMLTGAGVLNFFPAGLSEMPVAAPYVLAIQALALGGRRSEGKLLIVHCDDPHWTLHFARNYLTRNRFIINLANSNRLPTEDDPDGVLTRESPGGLNKEKRPKYPDAKAPKSLVMDDLMAVVTERSTGHLAQSYTSVTVYLLSNSGQGPSLAIEQMPGEFITFLQELHGSRYGQSWQRLVHRAWRGATAEAESTNEEGPPVETGKKSKAKPAKSAKAIPSGPGRSHNELYNDLLDIFDHGFCNWQAAQKFIRRHLLLRARCYHPKGIANLNFDSSNNPLAMIDWELTSLFLRKVLGMKQDRLERIRKFSEMLASIIDRPDVNGKKLFDQLAYTTKESLFRSMLTKLHVKSAKSGELAFRLDDYVTMFLLDDPDSRVTWMLVRDLIIISLAEQLYDRNFFARNPDEEGWGSEGDLEPEFVDSEL